MKNNYYPHLYIGLPWWLSGKESACLGKRLFQPLVGENSLEEVMATHSKILAREIPWTKYTGRLQSTARQKSSDMT